MLAALYGRVSTIDKNQNPEVQLVPMRDYCRTMGWKIYGEYVDHAPAADLLHRVNWSRMMKDASLHKFDIVLVWKVDRAFRLASNALNALDMLKTYNVRFRSYMEAEMDTGTIGGKMMFTFLSMWAEVEKEGIRERVIAGMDYAKVHGTRSGAPIGKPRLNVSLQTICKAVDQTRNADKSINLSAAARKLSEITKKNIQAGFVHLRIKREAASRNLSWEELIKNES